MDKSHYLVPTTFLNVQHISLSIDQQTINY